VEGCTLVLSREEKLYPYFKKRFTELGFTNPIITGEERDSLNMLIEDLKPRLVLASSTFYQCSTPFMIGRLLKRFPGLNIAAVSVINKIPDDLAMWFIFYGAKSYINLFDGPEEFYQGLKKIREGKEYISPSVAKRIDLRKEKPEPAVNLTSRHIEVVRLVSNGFTTNEICQVLNICARTVDAHKTDLYTMLNVRNENELIRTALFLGVIKPDELVFYGSTYCLNPKPEHKTKVLEMNKRRTYDYEEQKR
jgi:DNA-binding NarL/FixJ family response regulator